MVVFKFLFLVGFDLISYFIGMFSNYINVVIAVAFNIIFLALAFRWKKQREPAPLPKKPEIRYHSDHQVATQQESQTIPMVIPQYTPKETAIITPMKQLDTPMEKVLSAATGEIKTKTFNEPYKVAQLGTENMNKALGTYGIEINLPFGRLNNNDYSTIKNLLSKYSLTIRYNTHKYQ